MGFPYCVITRQVSLLGCWSPVQAAWLGYGRESRQQWPGAVYYLFNLAHRGRRLGRVVGMGWGNRPKGPLPLVWVEHRIGRVPGSAWLNPVRVGLRRELAKQEGRGHAAAHWPRPEPGRRRDL